MKSRHRGYLDVIVDIWQLQGKAAAEVPLCAAAGIAGRQLRPVRLHDMQPFQAYAARVPPLLQLYGQPTHLT